MLLNDSILDKNGSWKWEVADYKFAAFRLASKILTLNVNSGKPCKRINPVMSRAWFFVQPSQKLKLMKWTFPSSCFQFTNWQTWNGKVHFISFNFWDGCTKTTLGSSQDNPLTRLPEFTFKVRIFDAKRNAANFVISNFPFPGAVLVQDTVVKKHEGKVVKTFNVDTVGLIQGVETNFYTPTTNIVTLKTLISWRIPTAGLPWCLA